MDGILLVDKESGVTSHDVVDDLRKLLGVRAVGHGGTLDPLATGLLICLIGEATKLSSYVMSEDKSYRVGVRFGTQTDSGDITGQVVQTKDCSGLARDAVLAEVNKLVGNLSLPVPKYSAVKVKGRKLYDYARKDEDVEIPVKNMMIHKATLLEFDSGQALIDLDCEKGTYVRSWVERLGQLLGCGATVQSLRRLRSGPFKVESSHKISDFEKEPQAKFKANLVPLPDVMGGWPALKVDGRDLALVQNGQIPRGIYGQLIHFRWEGGVRLLTPEGRLLALAVKDPEKGVKLARVFNTKS